MNVEADSTDIDPAHMAELIEDVPASVLETLDIYDFDSNPRHHALQAVHTAELDNVAHPNRSCSHLPNPIQYSDKYILEKGFLRVTAQFQGKTSRYFPDRDCYILDAKPNELATGSITYGSTLYCAEIWKDVVTILRFVSDNGRFTWLEGLLEGEVVLIGVPSGCNSFKESHWAWVTLRCNLMFGRIGVSTDTSVGVLCI